MKENIFDRLNDWINGVEGSLVNFLTAFAPWLAPLIPAYMTYKHMIEFLHFDAWLAWVLALVVEILGFGTVSTGLDFWFYNRRNKAKTKEAPFALIILAFGFYLFLIVASNVLIDWATIFGTERQQNSVIIAVRFLLTLQTLPAALIVATRTGHRDLLREIKQERLEKSQKVTPKVHESFTKDSEEIVRDWRKLKPILSEQEMYNLAYLSPSQVKDVADQYNVTERTVENWRVNARKEIGVD